MKLPKKIKVGKKWYSVETRETFAINGKHVWGGINYDAASIRIGTHRSNGRALPEKEIDTTFWHELTHAVLKDMGSKLEANEAFVDAFSTRLSNAVRSARF